MGLDVGQHVGPYAVTAPLGAGGMGEVYRATDTKLGRDVAIKVLPAEVAGDAERLARFEREARLLASLNHPNIAHVYGFESATLPDGSAAHFLAMELVEGEDLAQRLKRGALPVDESLEIAKQIAEALEEAHEKGVVHRDLKPANVKLTPDGKVKVLDFGLAKAYAGDLAPGSSADLSQSPTLAHTGTQAGVILGTAAYMSPEQARGKPVDRRADIWAFGVVLFEMLTGRQLFAGETVSDTLAAVLTREPEWAVLPAKAPAHVRRLLGRCLERDPKRRLRDIGEARVTLERASVAGAREPDAQAVPRHGRPWLPAAAFVAGVALTLAGFWLRPGREIASPPVKRFALGGLVLTIDPLQGLALSPDGSRLVFRGRGDDGFDRLYVRELASFAVEPIPGTEQGFLPFFSPDGAWVGFFTQGSLKKVALSGGSSLTLASVASATGGTWLPDGSILFASEVKGLESLPATGGTPESVLMPEGDTPLVISPWALPGGKGVLLGVRRGEFFDVAVLSLAERKLRVIAEDGFAPTYTQSGYVVFQQGQASGTLLALPFDAERLVPTGPAFPVLSDIGTRISFQARMFTIAEDGTLAYIPSRAVLQRGALLWVDRNGASTPIVELDKPLDTPRLSPDDRLVAFRAPAPNCDVWVHDLERGVTTRVTFEGDNHGAAWLPDGRRVAFARQEQAEAFLLAGRADGSGAVERLSPRSAPRAWAASFSPDGRLLLVESRRAETGADVDLLSIPDQTLKPLLHSRFDEKGATFSPDGRFIAYVSDESGRDEVYVQRFPSLDTRQQVSTDGGDEPGWSRSGSELFLRRGRKMLVADVKAGPALEVSRPRLLFEADFAEGAGGERAYDVSVDGRRFVMTRPRSISGGGEIYMVLNWVDEMSRKGGATQR